MATLFKEQRGSALFVNVPCVSRSHLGLTWDFSFSQLKSFIYMEVNMLHEYSFPFMSKKAIGQHKSSCMQSKYKTGKLNGQSCLLKAELETPALDSCIWNTETISTSYQQCINFLPKPSGSWLCFHWHLN